MELKIPASAAHIIAALEEHGHEAYVVGGCVRDGLLGQAPTDWDICTAALPTQVMECFAGQRIIPSGLKHGTVTLLCEQTPYEVTTFRSEGAYSDKRRPDQVKFINSLRDDLARRDFTINALAWHPERGLIDYFDGAADLAARRLRAVGEAKQRFGEDALRIMRALRFAAVYGLSIEAATAQAIHEQRGELRFIAVERIQTELLKLLCGVQAAALLAEYSDVFTVFIPEIEPMIGFAQHNPYHHLDVWRHTLCALAAVPPEPVLRLTMLFHDMGKPNCCERGADGVAHFYGHAQAGAELAETIMRRLRCCGATCQAVRELVLCHDLPLPPQAKILKRRLRQLGREQLLRLLAVRRADTLAHHPACRAERLAQLSLAETVLQEILAAGQCFSLRDLAVDGHDIMTLGVAEGPQVGRVLDRLLDLVMAEQVANEKTALLAAARHISTKG